MPTATHQRGAVLRLQRGRSPDLTLPRKATPSPPRVPAAMVRFPYPSRLAAHRRPPPDTGLYQHPRPTSARRADRRREHVVPLRTRCQTSRARGRPSTHHSAGPLLFATRRAQPPDNKHASPPPTHVVRYTHTDPPRPHRDAKRTIATAVQSSPPAKAAVRSVPFALYACGARICTPHPPHLFETHGSPAEPMGAPRARAYTGTQRSYGRREGNTRHTVGGAQLQAMWCVSCMRPSPTFCVKV
ncbi:hypothetical protein HYPSUDRAFT_205175 [Hypholoma sublateritium FD-334 SS-4]|uniref:Uncharacterized protein n=1 Tax=Hypholoma sublateritium (strain FD-334 SS-4) TaxID=945553 RepID=A0A0D2NPD9_HYPSF|nr:hypothetical protein HYPSUDRAFT_205175 [Hypholoma sublateritium FD-334 SS-4]